MAKPIRGSQRILIRTAAEWTADDAVVPLGWWAVSYTGSTLNKVVIGDGVTAFSALDDQLGGGVGGATWGSITGTLSSQTDLQTALNGKAAASHTHAISDVTGLQTALDTKMEHAAVMRRTALY